VLVNVSTTVELKSKKGLRQGVPLTPFFYIIVAEGLVGVVR